VSLRTAQIDEIDLEPIYDLLEELGGWPVVNRELTFVT
jgi:hypothetical protein